LQVVWAIKTILGRSGRLRGDKYIYYLAQQVYSYARVPIGKTYVVYNSQGKKVAVFRFGRKTNMSKKCV